MIGIAGLRRRAGAIVEEVRVLLGYRRRLTYDPAGEPEADGAEAEAPRAVEPAPARSTAGAPAGAAPPAVVPLPEFDPIAVPVTPAPAPPQRPVPLPSIESVMRGQGGAFGHLILAIARRCDTIVKRGDPKRGG